MKNYILIILIVAYITIMFNEQILIRSKKILGDTSFTDKNIYLGQTIDLQNNQISIDYFRGIFLAFQSVNRKGGIKGYKINIVLLNDKYNVQTALNNAKVLVDYYNVLALFGTFGTEINRNIVEEVVLTKDVPLIGPNSNDAVFRENFVKNIIFTMGSIRDEINLIFNHMISKKIKNIGIIYQDTLIGNTAMNTLIQYVLSKKNFPINIKSISGYPKNMEFTYTIFEKLYGIQDPYLTNYNDPNTQKKIKELEAIILFAVDKQIPVILGTLKKINPNVYIYYNTYGGTDQDNYKFIENQESNIYQTNLIEDISKYPLLNEIFNNEKIFFNQTSFEITKGNKTELSKVYEKIDQSTSMMYLGFYTGLLIIEVLKSFDDLKDISRNDFIDRFYKIEKFNIYGLEIGPFVLNKNNVGIDYVSLNKIVDNKLVVIKEKDYHISLASKRKLVEQEDLITKQENLITKQENLITKQENLITKQEK